MQYLKLHALVHYISQKYETRQTEKLLQQTMRQLKFSNLSNFVRNLIKT